MGTGVDLRLVEQGEGWVLGGADAARFVVVDEFLAHLVDRNYSPKTVRAYGYDLLNFCRWLAAERIGEELGNGVTGGGPLGVVDTDVLLRYLRACRDAAVPGRPGPNVVAMSGRRVDRYAPSTINRRLAAISSLFGFLALRDPDMKCPVPTGKEARWVVAGERSGMLAHTRRRPAKRSSLRLREHGGCRWLCPRPRPRNCWAASSRGAISRSRD